MPWGTMGTAFPETLPRSSRSAGRAGFPFRSWPMPSRVRGTARREPGGGRRFSSLDSARTSSFSGRTGSGTTRRRGPRDCSHASRRTYNSTPDVSMPSSEGARRLHSSPTRSGISRPPGASSASDGVDVLSTHVSKQLTPLMPVPLRKEKVSHHARQRGQRRSTKGDRHAPTAPRRPNVQSTAPIRRRESLHPPARARRGDRHVGRLVALARKELPRAPRHPRRPGVPLRPRRGPRLAPPARDRPRDDRPAAMRGGGRPVEGESRRDRQ